MTDVHLWLDIKWDRMLPIQADDLFGGGNFALAKVPVKTVEIPEASNETVVMRFNTLHSRTTVERVEVFQTRLRDALSSRTGAGVEFPDGPVETFVGAYIQAGDDVPRPYLTQKPVLFVEQPEGHAPEAVVYEEKLRETMDHRVDVVRGGSGYNFIFDTDSITLSMAGAVADTLSPDYNDHPVPVFFAGRANAPANK